MTEQTVAGLNERFGVPSRVEFVSGPGNMPIAELTSPHAQATVALDGAQVLTYQPADQAPVLFVSEQATYRPGKSVRGGIPVCWPWFGGVRDNPEKPFHGFARMERWEVRAANANDEETTIELGLRESEASRRFWPHPFDLRLVVTLGASLRVDLIARNTDSEPVELTGALHSYFRVGEIEQVTIFGLEDTRYLDKAGDGGEVLQRGPVRITALTDRIYLDTSTTCVIDDPANNRRIVVAKAGSDSAVVWNPWAENARQIADMADDEYRRMVCVETTNAGTDIVTLAPGDEHQLTAIIRAEPRE